ncbi:hypothetical protein [Actinomadura sp. 9N215]|uniref:hypothetical protein n=1 Tax=Actinomadura sp. 9N215 TaxID=3375150 RepID=UPI0037AA962C
MERVLYWDPDRYQELLNELKQFQHDCGGPSNRALARLSVQVKREYRGRWELPVLSATAISDVFNHVRKTPQPWDWISCFVLACLKYAETQPGQPARDQSVVLSEWRMRWQAVHRADHGAARPSPESARDVVPAEISAMWEGHIPSPRNLSAPEWRILLRYDQHGVTLYRAAEIHGDLDASRRLGVLALLDGQDLDARAWLSRAAVEGHPAAVELLDSSDPVRLAVQQATELGAAAAEAADLDVALIYLKRAANFADAEAEFQLGEIYLELGGPEAAYTWFERAAQHGHPLAVTWLIKMSRDALRNGLTPPVRAARERSEGDAERSDDEPSGR